MPAKSEAGKGFWITIGVVAALVIVGIAYGVFSGFRS
jgi:hypothetical protein